MPGDAGTVRFGLGRRRAETAVFIIRWLPREKIASINALGIDAFGEGGDADALESALYRPAAQRRITLLGVGE